MFEFLKKNKKILFFILIMFFLERKKPFLLKSLDPIFFFSSFFRSFLKAIFFYSKDKNYLYEKYSKLEKKYEKLRHSFQSLQYLKNSIFVFKKEFATFNIYNKPFIISKILFLKLSNDEQIFFINSGENQNVKIGNCVVYGNDLLGIVLRTYQNYSEVLMTSDSRSKIAVKIGNNLINGIAQGFNQKNLIQIFYVENNSKIQENDIVYSSGSGLIYPEGFAVGKIKEILKNNDDLYLNLKMKPIVDINNIYYCYVLLNENDFFLNKKENEKEFYSFLDKIIFNFDESSDLIVEENFFQKKFLDENKNCFDNKNNCNEKNKNKKVKDYLNHFYYSRKNVIENNQKNN